MKPGRAVVSLDPLSGLNDTAGPMAVPFDARVLAIGTVEIANAQLLAWALAR